MYYETNCTQISIDKWDILMKGNRAANKRKVIEAALQTGVIDEWQAKEETKKPYFNPYEHRQTKTHFIYIHSAIEHFIHK